MYLKCTIFEETQIENFQMCERVGNLQCKLSKRLYTFSSIFILCGIFLVIIETIEFCRIVLYTIFKSHHYHGFLLEVQWYDCEFFEKFKKTFRVLRACSLKVLLSWASISVLPFQWKEISNEKCYEKMFFFFNKFLFQIELLRPRRCQWQSNYQCHILRP